MSLVFERNDLVSSCKDYLVFAYDRASSHRVHTYFGLASLSPYRMTVVYIAALCFKRVIDNVRKHYSRSARSVCLSVMMSFYYLLQDNTFATFCTQVLADDHTILFNFETEQAELLSLSKKLSSVSSEELHILTLMHIGIKEQMIQYLMFHPEMNVNTIAKMHLALLLSYIGQSRKKCNELIDAACEVLDMLSFQIDDTFTVTVSLG